MPDSGQLHRRLPRLAAGLLAASLLLLPACVGQAPEILRISWQINLVDDREQGLVYAALSLFVKPNDPDGIDDLGELFLINDEEQLYWGLDSTTWLKSGSGADTWIGANGIRLPDGSPLPAGEYRILLRDVGGASTEQTIRLPAFSVERARPLLPQVVVRDRQIRMSGKARSFQLWLYDRDGRYVAVYPVQGRLQALDELLAAYPVLTGGFRFRVCALLSQEHTAVVSGPYTWAP
jgi:hypothetical protein